MVNGIWGAPVLRQLKNSKRIGEASVICPLPIDNRAAIAAAATRKVSFAMPFI
jgi:hypothetical protein